MGEENRIRDAADAAKGILEAVPIYQDALQPAAKELGKTIALPVKVINTLLSPISGLVWGFDQIGDYLKESLSKKLANVPEENLVSPKTSLAGPTIEAMRFTAEEPDLREMYSNLLASAMDNRTAHEAHPAFVEIIKQLTSDEARIMKFFESSKSSQPVISINLKKPNTDEFIVVMRNHTHLGINANCTNLNMIQSYVDNLMRLGLIHIPNGIFFFDKSRYLELRNDQKVIEMIEKVKKRSAIAFDDFADPNPVYINGVLQLTNLGRTFIETCI